MIRFGQLGRVLAVSAAILGLAGCGSGGTEAAAPATTHPPTDAAGLARELQSSIRAVHSAHLTMTVAAGATTITGVGEELLARGKVHSMDLTETVPLVGELRIILDGSTTYLRLPTALNHTGKPWVLVSPTSSNPVVRQLGTALESARESTSLEQFTTFTTAARVTRHIQETLDGAPVTHYALSVDTAKLPATMPGRQQLMAMGLTTLPLEMWVDRRGRLMKVADTLTAKGQRVSTTVTIGQYDAPVTITPPPADQVSADGGTAPA